MDRILEPELMEGHDQVKAYSEADFFKTDEEMFRRLQGFISSIGFEISKQSLIVDLGCGPGNITEKLALHWPFANVMGIDGSAEMLKVALKRKEKLEKYFQFSSFSYLQKDLSLFSSGKSALDKPADVLISNSVLHHIHEPNNFWCAIRNLGKQGSVVFHRDLRRPSTLDEAIEIKEKYQDNAPPVLDKDYLASLLASFTVDEVSSQLAEAGLCQLKVFEVDDRYLEVVGVL